MQTARKITGVVLAALATVGILLAVFLNATDTFRQSGAQVDLTAYGHCIDYYHDADQCLSDVYAYRRVEDGTVSDQDWDSLMRQGWRGVSTDGREALYPPVGS